MKIFLVIAVIVALIGFIIAASTRSDVFRGDIATQEFESQKINSCADVLVEIQAFRDLGEEIPPELLRMAQDLQCL